MHVTDPFVTADEFMELPDENGVYLELVRGRIVRIVVPGARHGLTAAQLSSALHQHVESEGLGVALGRCSFRIERDPDTVRVPDMSFVSRDRVPKELHDSYFDGPADLAIEVLCPTDPTPMMEEKLAQYLERGVRMVWVVDPESHTVTVYEPGREPLTLREGDMLDGGDVVPGFSRDLRQIFR